MTKYGPPEIKLIHEGDLEIHGHVIGSDHLDREVLSLYFTKTSTVHGVESRKVVARMQMTRPQFEELVCKGGTLLAERARFVERHRKKNQ